jgi:hypothetical protein
LAKNIGIVPETLHQLRSKGRAALPFFGQDPIFYDLLEAQAEAAHKAAQAFHSLTEDFGQAAQIAENVKRLEADADNLTHDLVNKADSKFITPLDKGDMHGLSQALDNITDTLEAAVARIALYRLTQIRPDLAPSGSVFGVGIAKRLNEVRWPIAQQMVAAWVLTLPGAALVAGLSFFVISLGGQHAPVAVR